MTKIHDETFRKAFEYADGHYDLGRYFFLYDQRAISDNVADFNRAMSVIDGYAGNRYAVKCNWNFQILRVIAAAGIAGFDCANGDELMAVQDAGVDHLPLNFTATNVPIEEYTMAADMGAQINFGKPSDWHRFKDQWAGGGGFEDLNLGVRINPGLLKEARDSNEVIGEHFGMSPDDAFAVSRSMQDAGVVKVGLHMMAGSNKLDPEFIGDNAQILSKVAELYRQQGLGDLAVVNIGGGMGVPYRPGEEAIDINKVADLVNSHLGGQEFQVVSEFGRYIVADTGYFVMRCTDELWRTETDMYTLPVSGSVNNMSRLTTVPNSAHPVRYITHDGRELSDDRVVGGLAGSQCTSSDRYLRFTSLPEDLVEGDIVVVEMAGGHAQSNGSNFNLLSRGGAVMLKPDGSFGVVSKHETYKWKTANQVTGDDNEIAAALADQRS